MLININELGSYNFSLSEISLSDNLIKSIRSFEGYQKRNTLIYIISGRIRMTIENEEISFGANSVIYFPTGYLRKMVFDAPPTHYHRIDFDLQINGEGVTFFDKPTPLTDFSVSAMKNAADELNEVCKKSNSRLLKCEKICKILALFSKAEEKPINPKLLPAISYINDCFTEKINCRNLAEMCFLSTAQFYNLFNANIGTTPLEYRNRLLIKKATELLLTGEVSVVEVASALGFSDAAYFSRFFKKQTGISPLKYAKQMSGY